MTSPEEHLMDWLRDAHAMEKQAETMLSAMAGRLQHYPSSKRVSKRNCRKRAYSRTC